jgi:hypothetical protein
VPHQCQHFVFLPWFSFRVRLSLRHFSGGVIRTCHKWSPFNIDCWEVHNLWILRPKLEFKQQNAMLIKLLSGWEVSSCCSVFDALSSILVSCQTSSCLSRSRVGEWTRWQNVFPSPRVYLYHCGRSFYSISVFWKQITIQKCHPEIQSLSCRNWTTLQRTGDVSLFQSVPALLVCDMLKMCRKCVFRNFHIWKSSFDRAETIKKKKQ